MGMAIVECDIDSILVVLSKRGQSNHDLCIDVVEWYSSAKRNLMKLRTNLGPMATQYMEELSEGKLYCRNADKDKEEANQIFIKLTNSPKGVNNTKKRLLQYQVGACLVQWEEVRCGMTYVFPALIFMPVYSGRKWTSFCYTLTSGWLSRKSSFSCATFLTTVECQ